MISCEIVIGSTRALVITDNHEYVEICREEIIKQRNDLTEHIRKNPVFFYSLESVDCKRKDPEIVRMMSRASYFAGVGPMASVAGAISQLALERMTEAGSSHVVINNGGDICMKPGKNVTVGLFAGEGKRQNDLCVRVPKNRAVSICSSSSKMGHSLSFGNCDLATVIGKRGEICDAMATAVANRIKTEDDIEPELNASVKRKGIYKVIASINGKMGFAGKSFDFAICKDAELAKKIVGYAK